MSFHCILLYNLYQKFSNVIQITKAPIEVFDDIRVDFRDCTLPQISNTLVKLITNNKFQNGNPRQIWDRDDIFMLVPFITSSCIFCNHPVTPFYHIAPSPRAFLFLFFVTFLSCGHYGKMGNLVTITKGEPSIMSNTGHSAYAVGVIYLSVVLSLLHL